MKDKSQKIKIGGNKMHLQTSDQEKLELGFGGYTCNWGMHVCGLYETEAERDEIIMGFLHAGDLKNEQLIYFPSERTPENFYDEYGKRYPECKDHVHDRNRFSVNDYKEFYYPDGYFSPQRMLSGHEEYFAESQKISKRNVRATAEMVWALEKIPGVEHLMAYESRLNYFISGKPWISICLYNITKFSGKIIMNVLQTHPFAISGGVITLNPYFEDPEKWLKKNAPEFVIN
jgi:hypothetical protein